MKYIKQLTSPQKKYNKINNIMKFTAVTDYIVLESRLLIHIKILQRVEAEKIISSVMSQEAF